MTISSLVNTSWVKSATAVVEGLYRILLADGIHRPAVGMKGLANLRGGIDETCVMEFWRGQGALL